MTSNKLLSEAFQKDKKSLETINQDFITGGAQGDILTQTILFKLLFIYYFTNYFILFNKTCN